jgi:hypothetical protein
MTKYGVAPAATPAPVEGNGASAAAAEKPAFEAYGLQPAGHVEVKPQAAIVPEPPALVTGLELADVAFML